MSMRRIKIGDRWVGDGYPCFFVAEAGVNHEGSFEKAKELIGAAAGTSSDSIKFQHYTAAKLVSREAKRYWLVRGDEPGFQFDPNSYKDDQAGTFSKIDGIPREKDAELVRYAREKKIIMFSTPFDFESVDHLDKLGAPMFKIASGDLTYHQLIEYIAKKGKPVVLSTGAANLNEIRGAVDVIKKTGNDQIVLLHCTLAYPTPLGNANLLMMKHLQEEFPEALIGLSDHTPGIEADVAAAMLGAVMIEKHFTHTPGPAAGENKVGESPDHDIGIGAGQFAEMVRRIRENEKNGLSVGMGLAFDKAIEMVKSGKVPQVLGESNYKEVDSAVELKARAQARRSIVTESSLAKGTLISRELIDSGKLTYKRPGMGIPPYEADKLIGKAVKQNLPADTVLGWHHFEA